MKPLTQAQEFQLAIIFIVLGGFYCITMTGLLITGLKNSPFMGTNRCVENKERLKKQHLETAKHDSLYGSLSDVND